MRVDRRSFVAGMGVSTLPLPVYAGAYPHHPAPTIAAYNLLIDRLALSTATAEAMMGRARRLTGAAGLVFFGSPDGSEFKLLHAESRTGTWLLRGQSDGRELLSDAVAFACERASDKLLQGSAYFRWFSGCSFSGYGAHLFRGHKSAMFVVSRAYSNLSGSRLDIVTI